MDDFYIFLLEFEYLKHIKYIKKTAMMIKACVSFKDNTVNRLNIRVRLCSHHLSFHLKMQILMKSIRVYMSGPLEFMYTISI